MEKRWVKPSYFPHIVGILACQKIWAIQSRLYHYPVKYALLFPLNASQLTSLGGTRQCDILLRGTCHSPIPQSVPSSISHVHHSQPSRQNSFTKFEIICPCCQKLSSIVEFPCCVYWHVLVYSMSHAHEARTDDTKNWREAI